MLHTVGEVIGLCCISCGTKRFTPVSGIEWFANQCQLKAECLEYKNYKINGPSSLWCWGPVFTAGIINTLLTVRLTV